MGVGKPIEGFRVPELTSNWEFCGSGGASWWGCVRVTLWYVYGLCGAWCGFK